MPEIIQNVKPSDMTEETSLPAVYAATPKWLRATVISVELFLVIMLGYFASQLITASLSGTGINPGKALPPAPVQYARPMADYSLVTRFDPFFRRAATIAEDEAAPVQETSLKIRLFGLRAEGEGTGNAILQLEGDKQRLVRTGETFASGIRLVGVYADRIEISRAGIREAVYMFKNKQPAAARPARGVRGDQGLREESNRQTTGKTTGQTTGKISGKTARESGLLTALSALQWEAARQDNRIIGFRITSEIPPGVLPLAKGDIVQSVNGFRLNSFENLQELPDEISGASRFVIEFLRRGERLTETIG